MGLSIHFSFPGNHRVNLKETSKLSSYDILIVGECILLRMYDE
jgi:hypothetical protein